MKIEIPTKARIFLRSMITIAVGGASGTVENLLASYMAAGDFTHVDGHRVLMTAAYGAILGLCYHFKKPPNAPTINPNATDISQPPGKSL